MLVNPVVGAGGWFLLMFVDVDLEALASAFVLPVGDGVADVVKERTSAKIEVANKHAAEMADMGDIVPAGANGGEEFDGAHHRHVRAHRNCDWERNEPDAAVWKEHSVGHENAENSAGGANGRNQRRLSAEEHGDSFDDELDDPCARPADEEIIQKTALPPDELQIPAEHPEHQHVDEQMPQAAMQKNVGERLPNPRRDMVRYSLGDQRKPLEEPNCSGGRSEQPQESLHKENAGADQYEEFYAWGYEAAPIEVIAPRAEGASHSPSLRRSEVSVKGPMA